MNKMGAGCAVMQFMEKVERSEAGVITDNKKGNVLVNTSLSGCHLLPKE